jgi:hypothetical protein
MVRGALMEGRYPPPYPPLRMPDAALAASLWNQAVQAAALDDEQTGRVPLPDATAVAVREWFSSAVHAFEESGPGEPLTARDRARSALEAAQAKAAQLAELLQSPSDLAATIAKWLGITLGVGLALYLLYKLSQR